ncbi:MAG: ABC transporter permease subunit [Erysipelotrichaceae bacterium]|nr:ABC transporter permease subunit [Erysipelotrichaceae bacterium]
MEKNIFGKIKTEAHSKASTYLKILVVFLAVLTVYQMVTMDTGNKDFFTATSDTLRNINTVFLSPMLRRDTLGGIINVLMVTLCIAVLSTIFGAIFALICALLCADNLANKKVAAVVKAIVAVVRAIPTVLWVLIFAVSAGLGATAAVVGLTFHSFAYLVKAYSEAIEEDDKGKIEALRASGAGFMALVTQAIFPSCIRMLVAWTFMRFEINFTNAVAMGAAAGAGGIGYNLYMAGNMYFDLREMGFLTYVVLIMVIILEQISTRFKESVK